MFKFETLTKTEATVEKLIADREAEIARLHDLVEQDAAAVDAAAADMEAAVNADNIEAYRTAKAAKTNAADVQDMHRRKLQKLETEPYITEAEYKAMLQAVRAEFDTAEAAAWERLVELAGQMKAISDELEAAQRRANPMLAALQDNVCKGIGRTRNQRGEIMPMAHETAKVEKWEAINYGRRPAENALYKQHKNPAPLRA